jgi:spore germination protein KC
MRGRLLAILLLCFVLLLSGCGYKDIDRRAFPVVMGVDQGKGHNVIVTLRVAVPEFGGASSEGQNSVLYSQEAANISEAVRLLKAQSDREIDYAHCKVIIFGRKLVETDLARHIDWFLRRRDIQNIAWLTMADQEAREILEVKPIIEKIPGNSLFLSFGNTGVESQYIGSQALYQVFRAFVNHGETPYLPIIAIKKDHYRIDRIALLNKKRLVEELPPQDAAYFKLLESGLSKGMFHTSDTTLNVMSVAAHYELSPGVVHITIKGTVNIEETNSLTPRKPGDIPRYEKELESTLRRDLEKLVSRFIEEGIDPLGLQQRFEARHWNADERKRWEEQYPKANVTVSTDIEILHGGLLR